MLNEFQQNQGDNIFEVEVENTHIEDLAISVYAHSVKVCILNIYGYSTERRVQNFG